jgi:CBS domain-containing protein
MSFSNDTVADVMQRYPITIQASETLADAARLFESHQFHSAPVTDENGVCIGIITSSDLVRFEASRKACEIRSQHGVEFDTARYDNEARSEPRYRFDQIGAQMTREFRSVAGGVPLLEAISLMHRERLHHLLVLDGLGKPYGILSTIDVLGRVIGHLK